MAGGIRTATVTYIVNLAWVPAMPNALSITAWPAIRLFNLMMDGWMDGCTTNRTYHPSKLREQKRKGGT